MHSVSGVYFYYMVGMAVAVRVIGAGVHLEAA